MKSDFSQSFRRLVEHEFEGFRSFAESVEQAFKQEVHGFSILLSPCLSDPNELVVISKAGQFDGHVAKLTEIRKISAYFDEFEVNSSKVYFAMEKNFDPKDRALMSKLLRAAMIRLWGDEQAQIRHEVIRQTVRSRDMNSFLHRVVYALRDSHIRADEISVFTQDTIRNSLSLSATTRRVDGIQKKDVYYMLDDISTITDVFLRGQVVSVDSGRRVPTETWDQHLYRGRIHTQLIAPIQLPDSYLPNRPSELGVIRISNFRHNGKASKKYRITEYDLIITRFVSEVIFVLIQKYLQYQEHEQEVSRLTHGLGANIDAAVKFYDNCREVLFKQPDADSMTSVRQFSLRSGGQTAEEDFSNMFFDLGSFVDDLHFQFNNATAVAGAIDLDGTIYDFHTDVLMPLVRVAPSIAAVHNRSEPKFNRFKEAGSLSTPPLQGNVDAVISVFRNLVDNSIKYNDNDVAKIEMVFASSVDHFDVIYCDNGIGVPDKERERIFIEGFRTDAARRRTFSGAGIGLSYSREIMQEMQGNIECLPYDGGARFRVRFKIHG